MAIKLPGGRIMRTLPEQVDKNMQDIASINNEVNVIKESITTAYKIQGSATVADLNANTPDAAMNGYVYNMTDAGSLINSDESTTSVQIGDNVVLVWNDGNYFWDRLSGVVDTSNLVTLDTDQEITGVKKFINGLKIGGALEIYSPSQYVAQFNLLNSNIMNLGSQIEVNRTLRAGTNNALDLGTSSYTWKDLYLSGGIHLPNNIYITYNGNYNAIDFGSYTNGVVGGFFASKNNGDLGASYAKWKDLYLSGNITDGTNSIAVAQISKTKLYLHTLTVSNITPPVCVVLNSNVALSGSVGSNLGPRMIVTAYLASNYVPLLKTPNGSLIQINSDLTLSTVVSSGETITADTVTEF